MTVFFDIFHFKIRNSRLEMRVPIDEAFIAVNQPRLIHLNKGFGHGFGHFICWVFRVTKGELLA